MPPPAWIEHSEAFKASGTENVWDGEKGSGKIVTPAYAVKTAAFCRAGRARHASRRDPCRLVRHVKEIRRLDVELQLRIRLLPPGFAPHSAGGGRMRFTYRECVAANIIALPAHTPPRVQSPGMAEAIWAVLCMAFAAIAVWLSVRVFNRRERWAKWTLAVVACVPVLYVASFGPACWLTSRAYVYGEPVVTNRAMFVYFPIGKMILRHPNSRRSRLLISWIRAWLPTDRTATIPTNEDGHSPVCIEHP
jgi:hypothetical protein